MGNKTGGNAKRKRRTKNYSDIIKERNHNRKIARHQKWATKGMADKRRRIMTKLTTHNVIKGDEASQPLKKLRKRLYPFTKHNPVYILTLKDQLRALHEEKIWKSSDNQQKS